MIRTACKFTAPDEAVRAGSSDVVGPAGRFRVMRVNPVTLPPESDATREPTRPPVFRDATFEERFDRLTLAYDTILMRSSGQVRVVAPALLNLTRPVANGTISSTETGRPCPFHMRELDRQTQLLIEATPETRSLDLDCALGRFQLQASLDNNDLFAGERAIFTLSKNNKLEWIMDWVRFYRDVHGATAVLIFDNASTEYTSQALLDAVTSVGGLNAAVVVEWPFKHGPTGVGHKKYWDSNFSQLGAFEVARWRFLQDASSVLNCDIDELVVSRNSVSIFDFVERRRSGVAAFYGDWVFGIEDLTRRAEPEAPIRFRDFTHVLARLRAFKYGLWPHLPMQCRPKWAAVPRRCPPHAQWNVHTVTGWWAARVITTTFRFRHYREINFSWKYDRLGRERLDRARHVPDALMASAFAQVDWDA